jgi:transposase
MYIHIIYINNDYHTINSKKELQLSIIYSTDLTDKQWDIIKPLLPAPKKRGHPRVVDLRRIINGILYINRTGCQWRMLPKEFLPRQTTYGYFRQFRINGTWDLIHDTLHRINNIWWNKKDFICKIKKRMRRHFFIPKRLV